MTANAIYFLNYNNYKQLKIHAIETPGTIIILRERQFLLKVLKLWIVVNDTNLYELKEEQPLPVTADPLPIKITAKNGFHFSKPFYITQRSASPVYIAVSCEADNGRLWGGVLISVFLFVLFFATGLYFFMVLANLPLLYLVYLFFLRPKNFITIEQLKTKSG